MITNFSEMVAFLEAQAKSTAGVVDFVHVGSGEILVHRISKYYENQYKAGQGVFVDTSEGFLDDSDISNVRMTFLLGITILSKARAVASEQDAVWNNTLVSMIGFIGKLRHAEKETEAFEMEVVENRLNQVSKVVNADVMGWRNEIMFTFNVNSLYCNCE